MRITIFIFHFYLDLFPRCNVDRLKLLRDALPLEGEFPEVWLKINKIIDNLHIKNHKVNCVCVGVATKM